MPTPWDAFLKERTEKDPNYLTWAPVSKILEDFYHYLEKEGKIRT